MRKLIPSREEMDEFLTLLKRYSLQCRTCFEWDLRRGQNSGSNPYIPLSALHDAIHERLRTLDFLSPFGWSDGVSQALEALRSGALHYHVSRFQDITPIKTGKDKGKVALVFNPGNARAVLEDLARRIEEIETVMSAERQVEVRPKKGETVEDLRDRLELILAVFDKDNPGPLRGKKIAELSRLHYDAHLRADLSQLKSLGFLKNNGQGYTRTDKPYPMS